MRLFKYVQNFDEIDWTSHKRWCIVGLLCEMVARPICQGTICRDGRLAIRISQDIFYNPQKQIPQILKIRVKKLGPKCT